MDLNSSVMPRSFTKRERVSYLPLCLLLGFVKVLIQRARGEKRGVGAAAVLFEVVEVHPPVFADGLLFG